MLTIRLAFDPTPAPPGSYRFKRLPEPKRETRVTLGPFGTRVECDEGDEISRRDEKFEPPPSLPRGRPGAVQAWLDGAGSPSRTPSNPKAWVSKKNRASWSPTRGLEDEIW